MPNYLLNDELFNADHTILWISQDAVEFNNYSLMTIFDNDYGVWIQKANLYDVMNIDIAQFVSEQIDWGWILQKKYGNKSLTLTLFIQASSNDDLITRIEALKQKTRAVEGNLDIRVKWEMRTYLATVSWVRIPAFTSLDDYVQGIELDLIITSPHWYLKTPVVTTTSSIVADTQKIIYNTWTYDTYPLIYFVLGWSWNAITQLDIEVRSLSDATGYTLSITEALTDNDVLILNYKTKTVTLNGTEINFSGFMAPMKDGYTVFDFDFTGTVNLTNYIIFNPTFL